jgi:diaminohydroxyphosphoribosylaminopyrimidine deaminase/5-amino-6-(5-phosphoribosylamino)uracil reductase
VRDLLDDHRPERHPVTAMSDLDRTADRIADNDRKPDADCTLDGDRMRDAIAAAAAVRRTTAPNPWVGSVVVAGGRTFTGATGPPGHRHAEIAAMHAARLSGVPLRGATVYTTLEPCAHQGRTPPCTEAIIEAGVGRVVVGIVDPDANVAGRGIDGLRASGVRVDVGVERAAIEEQLRPYLVHRRTGRPFVVLKLASTLDGRTAAADGTSRWITGDDARTAVHELRADSDAICVGAGTVRADDPELTVRGIDGRSPRRVVLGRVPEHARVRPCLEWTGGLGALLDRLGADGVLQLLVEGGAAVAGAFHRAGLVDRYVVHLAPAFLGGDDGRPLFAGPGAPTIGQLSRGRVAGVRRLGDDVEIVVDSVGAS